MPVASAVQSCPFIKDDQAEQDPEQHWIQFQIQGTDGLPVSGVTVRLKLADGNIAEADSDDDGIVFISNVPAGACELISSWKTFDVHSSVFIK